MIEQEDNDDDHDVGDGLIIHKALNTTQSTDCPDSVGGTQLTVAVEATDVESLRRSSSARRRRPQSAPAHQQPRMFRPSFGDLSEFTRAVPLENQLRPNLRGKSSGHTGFRYQGGDRVRASSTASVFSPKAPRRGGANPRLGRATSNSHNLAASPHAVTFGAEDGPRVIPDWGRTLRPHLSGQGASSTFRVSGAKAARVKDLPSWPRPVPGQGQPRSGSILAQTYGGHVATAAEAPRQRLVSSS